MTDLNLQLHAAERAHRQLRAHAPDPGNLDPKAQLLGQILPALDAARDALPHLRSTAERLAMDAEFFAGRTDAEGYRDRNEVWTAYEELRSANRSTPAGA